MINRLNSPFSLFWLPDLQCFIFCPFNFLSVIYVGLTIFLSLSLYVLRTLCSVLKLINTLVELVEDSLVLYATP